MRIGAPVIKHMSLLRRLSTLPAPSVLAPMTNLSASHGVPPLRLVRGHGIHVADENGKEYIEAMSGLWCTGLGWGNEELVQACADQMRKLSYYHGFTDRRVPVVEELAAALLERVPPQLQRGRVFFGQSGSDANDTQVRLIWCYNHARGLPEKRNFISRHRGYHGVTVAAGSLTGLPYVHGGSVGSGLPLDFVTHVSAPHYYRNGRPGETEAGFVSRLAAELEAEIQRRGPHTVAGFIAEPMQGAGGVIVPPEGYHAAMRAVCDRHDVLLMGDEVITGLGRTGHFWGCQHPTIAQSPDLISCAKQLTSAYMPLSATFVPSHLVEALDDATRRSGMVFGHGYTYSGHPVACAVALKVLEIYDRDSLIETVRTRLGVHFQSHLAGLRSSFPNMVGEARGLGLVGAVELVADVPTKRPFAPEAAAAPLVARLALERGLVVRPLAGDAVAICPPLISTTEQLDTIFERLADAMAQAERELAPWRAK